VTLARGRVLRANSHGELVVIRAPLADSRERARRLSKRAADAEAEAAKIMSVVEKRGAAILSAAEARAKEIAESAANTGRAQGLAEVLVLAVREEERRAAQALTQTDRAVELATLLAERLLGETLAVSPGRIGALAAQALKEARGARKITIFAHPEDAAPLRASLLEIDAENRVHRVEEDASLGRGDLHLETDVGVIDARLGEELAHLGERLKEALRT
jgi:flagellar biosynthesis/type III secretory pathway protein FliH